MKSSTEIEIPLTTGHTAGIIEDDVRYRNFLTEELERHSSISRVVSFKSAEEYLEDDTAGFLDLVFVDLILPNMAGDELVALIRERNPSTIICLLSSTLYEEKVFACLRNGAIGYAWKEDIESIQSITTTLLSGGGIITPSVAVLIAEHFNARPAIQAELSSRERQIMELITSGMQAVAAAKTLGISENTIRSHITSIYRKLQVKNLSQLHAKVKNTRPD